MNKNRDDNKELPPQLELSVNDESFLANKAEVTENENIENGKKGDRPHNSTKYKKLPVLYRGNFTSQKLNRKILKRIFIPADRFFVESFYRVVGKTKKGTDLYSIPKETSITKKELIKLNLIAKEIKSQKRRIKWIPLIAVVTFLFIVSVLFVTFKNKVIKSFIQDTCESIFQAKCDIGKVDFRLFDASFKMYNLQIANKNSPMKNLIDIDSIVLDFDLTQMLRLRFVTDEISINGVKTNTNRKYSGDISAKLAKQREKKRKQEEKKAAASPFMKAVNSHIDATVETIQNSVTGFINYYNPPTVIENTLNSMTTDDVAKNIERTILEIYEKWKEKPEKINLQIQATEEVAKKLIDYKYSEISNNPEKMKEAFEIVTEAYNQAKAVKEETESIVKEIQIDFNSVQGLANDLEKSINHDKSLIDSVISRYRNLNVYTIKNFANEVVNKASYTLLGKYYPTVHNVVSYLIEMKNMNKQKEKKSEKEIMNSMLGDRSHGRTVYYKNNPPKFWIKKIAASGNFGIDFSFIARNISSNMDQSGLPASVMFSMKIEDITHSANVVVDCRSYSKEPLVLINYNCDNLPISTGKNNNSDDGIPGIPIINTKSNLDGVLKIFEDDGFSLTGTGIFSNMIITSLPFEPEYLYKVYSNVLSRIQDTKLSATVGYTVSKGLQLNFDTDLGDKIFDSLENEMKVQIEIIKKEAELVIVDKINQYTGGVLGQITSFEDIFNKINEYANYAKTLESELKKKQKEYETLINNYSKISKQVIKQTVNNRIENAKEEMKDASQTFIKELFKF